MVLPAAACVVAAKIVVGFEQRNFCSGTGGQSACSDAHELTAIPGIITHYATSQISIGES